MDEIKDKITTSDFSKESHNDLVFSYLTLRNWIGFLGMSLPLILMCTTFIGEGDPLIAPSISDYYYTSNGDVLVVLLSILGVFLFTYKGYTTIERTLTSIAAISAIGVAFSPTSTSKANLKSIHVAREAVPQLFSIEIHLFFAAAFFISLAIMALVFFPKSSLSSIPADSQKSKRNVIYKICGWIMLVCVVMLVLYFISSPKGLQDVPVVFIFETVAIEAFGLAWITKGETLWPDATPEVSTID